MDIHDLLNEMFYEIFNYLDIDSIKNFRLVDTLICSITGNYMYQKYYYDNDKILDNKIKKNIRHVIIKSVSFLQEYPNIRKLILFSNEQLNQGILPASLTSLKFGYHFNQPLAQRVLPASLTSLIFGYLFNKPLTQGVFPASLISLNFGDYFDQPLAQGVLPASLTSLNFGDLSTSHYHKKFCQIL